MSPRVGERAAVPPPSADAAEALAGERFGASGGTVTPGCSVAFQTVTLLICHVDRVAVAILHLLLFSA